jgi:diadenosine tetraphosphate (Ap4A) HIT family hydrolase
MEKVPDIILAENNVVAAMDIDKSNSGYLLFIKQQKFTEYKKIIMVTWLFVTLTFLATQYHGYLQNLNAKYKFRKMGKS